MRWPITLLGVVWLVLGGAVIVNPEIVKKLIDYIDGVKARIYSIGVLRLVLGALLVASAANARLYGFVLTIGIIIVLSGIACFAVPYDRVTKLVAWYRERSLVFYRSIGILVLVLASILLFAC